MLNGVIAQKLQSLDQVMLLDFEQFRDEVLAYVKKN